MRHYSRHPMGPGVSAGGGGEGKAQLSVNGNMQIFYFVVRAGLECHVLSLNGYDYTERTVRTKCV